MKQKVRLHQLFKRALEGLDKLGRQLADEAHRVGQHDLPARRQGDGPHGRVESGEQHVLAENSGPCQPVEQGRFASVGIPDQRHRRHLAARAVAALKMAGPFHLLQLALDPHHPVHQHPPVKLDLAFARTAQEPAAAALAFKVGPAPHKPASLECHGSKLDLKAAGMGLGAHAEDFEDQGGAVDDLAACAGFKVTLLHRAEAGIDNNQRMVRLLGDGAKAFEVAASQKGVGARLVEGYRFRMDDIKADGPHQLHRLCQHGVGASRQRHGAHIRVDHKCGAGSQSRSLLWMVADRKVIFCPTGRKKRPLMQATVWSQHGRHHHRPL